MNELRHDGLHLRASDADRERVAAYLRDQCSEGRLSPDELAERVGRAYAARTLWQLEALVRDLPGWPLGAAPTSVADAGNAQAIVGLVLGIVGLSLLLGSFGFLAISTLPCAVLAVIFGKLGKRKVDRGVTQRHRGLAQASLVTGIVGTALSLLGLILFAWAVTAAGG